MKSDNFDLSNAQKLMLVQGISLIEDGLQFLNWVNMMPNEVSFDLLTILRDRFEAFKDYALEEKSVGHLFIDRAKTATKNVDAFEEKGMQRRILEQLGKYREEIVEVQRERKKE